MLMCMSPWWHCHRCRYGVTSSHSASQGSTTSLEWGTAPCTHPPCMPDTPSAQPAYLLASLATFCRSHALSHLPLPLQMCHLTGTAADRVQGHTLDHPVEEHQVTLCCTHTHCGCGLTVMSCCAPPAVITPTPAGLAPGAAVSGAEHRAGSADAG